MMCVHLCGCVYVFMCATPVLLFNNAPRASRGSDVPSAVACIKKGFSPINPVVLAVSCPHIHQQSSVLLEHFDGPAWARLGGSG